MSFDTTSENKTRQELQNYDEIWVFGYGSLIYKVDFPYLEKASASIKGWVRRFWQGSHDHRGTPERPGRVVTLVRSELDSDECVGMAYRVTHEVFDHLDHREKNGYLRFEVDIHFSPSLKKTGLVYIAPEDNAAFLGPSSSYDIAKQIAYSCGPSGHNRDYVFQLAESLRDLNARDDHVFAIEGYLKQLMDAKNDFGCGSIKHPNLVVDQ
ncbi:gamma-glutamylcyclotransferase [Aliikangiella coralliicola]|uniref:glutathione-specific gamma-glutamylcyclotransferase n=1 Tax=Aliikangiella coralliicola TaxID=2592383 RepID=A0A545UDS9_9GAMM|nr:gamma-glutamylcyclotransferase [Aliikangiella coralliicola]TQV87618.1 gamma-glutamylcyclotransferase [Aliikangiella coralliicola]